jgi:hypothetical protein
MILLEIDAEGIAVLELEGDAPRPIAWIEKRVGVKPLRGWKSNPGDSSRSSTYRIQVPSTGSGGTI